MLISLIIILIYWSNYSTLYCRATQHVSDGRNQPIVNVRTAIQNVETSQSVERWKEMYSKLYDLVEDPPMNEDVEVILQEMVTLEKTNDFRSAMDADRSNPNRDNNGPLAKYDQLEQTARANNLIPRPELGFSETLLKTFYSNLIDCFETSLKRMANLTNIVVSFTLILPLMMNNESHIETCWGRYMQSFSALTSLMSSDDLSFLDDILEQISFKTIHTPTIVSKTTAIDVIKKETFHYPNAIGNILLDRAYDRANNLHNLATAPSYQADFDLIVKRPCDNLVQLTTKVMSEFSRFVRFISGSREFMTNDHSKLVNRIKMCQLIVFDASLVDRVVNVCKAYDKRQIAIESRRQERELQTQPTTGPQPFQIITQHLDDFDDWLRSHQASPSVRPTSGSGSQKETDESSSSKRARTG